MPEASPRLQWSGQFDVAPISSTKSLFGDKILLPPSALEQLLAAASTVTLEDRSVNRPSSFDPFNPYTFTAERHARAQTQIHHQQLPHPLTFRLVNSLNGRVVHAGILEFSAEEGQAGLSQFLLQALGLSEGLSTVDSDAPITSPSIPHTLEKTQRVTIHAQQLPKGTYVKLRPLEAGYNPEDWKALLEQYLQKNFTTLTKGEILTIPAGRERFQFLIDEFTPGGEGICVVDTDIEVDIEALNEEQAHETLKRITEKAHLVAGTADSSSPGGNLSFFKSEGGQVLAGDYVDYQIQSWDRSQGLDIELTAGNNQESLELFVSPFSTHSRARPRDDVHAFSDFKDGSTKRVRLSPTNIEMEDADAVWVSVHAPAVDSAVPSLPRPFSLKATASSPTAQVGDIVGERKSQSVPPSLDEVRCNNCQQYVPKQRLVLHENFCFRNNIYCPQGCGQVFQKQSPAYQTHWHCPHDDQFGNTSSSHSRHNNVFHTPVPCPDCEQTFASLSSLAQHRTTTCPGKLILCRFCHLVVPQEGDPSGEPNAEALLSGLAPHELADGSRTTECHLCARIVRLRDMAIHLKNHDLERSRRSAPRLCRNVNCGRTLDVCGRSGDTRAGAKMGQGAGNDIGLCSVCFGPLYVSMYDPEGKALRRRVERRYLAQLLTGCGRQWCKNEFCKSARGGVAVATKDALPMVKPFVNGLSDDDGRSPLHFCVDESSQKKRALAGMLATEGGKALGLKEYTLPWCVGALEAEEGDLQKARDWLANFAPTRKEEQRR